MSRMKVVLVLLDGLGDRTYAALDHRTPLAAAHTPNLDQIARAGGNGIYHAALPGQCLPSEMAHYLMFGYDRAAFPGRGFLEAAGEGVPFADRDVVVLAHLSQVGFSGKGAAHLAYGRDEISGGRDFLDMFYRRLTPYETNGIFFELHHTGRNDGLLVIKGDVSPDISDSDPVTAGMPVGRIVPLAESREPVRAARTADAMNRYLSWCHDRLREIKPPRALKAGEIRGNFLLTQRAGRRVPQVPFSEKWGFTPAMIASGGVYKGLAMALGFDFTRAQDSASPGQDLAGRIQAAIDDDAHDFIHVHTKVPDEVSHKATPTEKKKAISALDTGFKGLLNALKKRDDLLAVVTADHSTPSCSGLVHSGETVPLAMAGGMVRRDRVTRFDEIAAVSGSLGFLRGGELMHMILNCTDRAILDGLRMGADRRPYLHENYPPFRRRPE